MADNCQVDVESIIIISESCYFVSVMKCIGLKNYELKFFLFYTDTDLLKVLYSLL